MYVYHPNHQRLVLDSVFVMTNLSMRHSILPSLYNTLNISTHEETNVWSFQFRIVPTEGLERKSSPFLHPTERYGTLGYSHCCLAVKGLNYINFYYKYCKHVIVWWGSLLESIYEFAIYSFLPRRWCSGLERCPASRRFGARIPAATHLCHENW